MNQPGNILRGIIEYREPEEDTKYGRKKYLLFRIGLCSLILLIGYGGVRYGVNVYLARLAEGELQTASSYQKIYQSFARVEARQLHIQKKWENHRGMNGSQDEKNENLLFLMSGSSVASAALGEVMAVTGLGNSGIGQYRQYMTAGESGSDVFETWEKYQDGTGRSLLDGEGELTERQREVIEPDQFVVEGEFIYTLWQEGDLSYDSGETHLVVYHVADGRLDQIYVSPWVMSEGSGAELMVSGHYLYITTNISEYEEGLDELKQKSCAAYVYDITDPSHPKRAHMLTQSGEYTSMRIQGKYLYIFSKFQDFEAWDQKDVDDYIPKVDGKKILAEDIYIQRDLYGTGYVVISAYSLENPASPKLMMAKAVAGTAELVRIGEDQIYICSEVVPKNSDRTDRTGVTILSYENGEVNGTGHLIVTGSIDMMQPVRVNGTCLSMHMKVHSYRGSFVEIEGWMFPGWEGVPLKIQMGEESIKTEEQFVCVDGAGDKVHEMDDLTSEEMIQDTSFHGQLFAVDERNFIGVGHTGDDKNVKLLWYRFVTEDQPVIQAGISLKEYYSLVTEDVRMIYFDAERALIGFCTTGSRGVVYYLYRYQQEDGIEGVSFQKLCEENFGKDSNKNVWIRGTMMPTEEDTFYMIRSGGYEMSGLSLRLDRE